MDDVAAVPAHVIDAVGEQLRRASESGRVGLVIGVITPDGELIRGGGRVAADPATAPGDVEPDACTLFEIGSITKVFTGLALAIAVQRGEVALDTPLAALLPSGIDVPSRDGRVITLQDLATHTAALPRVPRGMLRELYFGEWKEHRANPYAALTQQYLHDSLGRTRLRREPGSRFRYSNLGMGLLGNALAARAGTSYEQLVRERICTPLGLNDTVVTLDSGQQARFAAGHNRRRHERPAWDGPALAGAGGLRSTGTDILAFLRAQMAAYGGSGLPADLAAAMRLSHEQRFRANKRYSIGLAWMMMPLPKRGPQVLWHNGGTGGFRSVAGFVPDRGVGVVVLGNTTRSVDRIGLAVLDGVVSGSR